jgi:hypothetical protein
MKIRTIVSEVFFQMVTPEQTGRGKSSKSISQGRQEISFYCLKITPSNPK